MHPSLLREPIKVKEDAVDLRILTDDVYITQANGRVVHPEVGVTVTVHDLAVVGALLKFKKAEEVGAKKKAHAAEPTDPPAAPLSAPVTVDELPEVARVDAPKLPAPEVVRWGNIPGISETSLDKLNNRAPDKDPRTATLEELQTMLGSTQRAGYVHRAIQDFIAGKGAEASGEG